MIRIYINYWREWIAMTLLELFFRVAPRQMRATFSKHIVAACHAYSNRIKNGQT